MRLYRYRIFPVKTASEAPAEGGGKAEAIAEGRMAAESLIPHGETRIVKRFQGTRKLATYRVTKDIRGGCRWVQLPNE